jgi:hypothetical protein
MRRFAMVLAIIVAGVGVSVAAGDAKAEAIVKDLTALKGTWRMVSAIRDALSLFSGEEPH